jgi:hypothetical protein
MKAAWIGCMSLPRWRTMPVTKTKMIPVRNIQAMPRTLPALLPAATTLLT